MSEQKRNMSAIALKLLKLFIPVQRCQRYLIVIIILINTKMGSNLQLAVKDNFSSNKNKGVPYVSSIQQKGKRPTKIFDTHAFYVKYCRKEERASITEFKVQEEKDRKLVLTATVQDCQSLIQEGPFEIHTPEKYPYSAVGLIYSRLNNSPLVGTGCIIGPNIVLTCAHNLYDARSKEMHTDIQFIPSPVHEELHVKTGYKPKRVFIPDKFLNSNPDREARYNQCFLYDYAVLVLDAQQNLDQYFGSFGYDFDWQDSEEHKQLMRGNRIMQDVEIIGYIASRRWGVEFYRVDGSAFADINFLVYTMSTRPGLSGSPVLIKRGDEYIIRAIHQRDISDIIQGQQHKKAGLKLRTSMFEDIKTNLRTISHEYNLQKKHIAADRVKILAQLINQREKDMKEEESVVISLDFSKIVRDQGCQQLTKMNLSNLYQLNLWNNNIGQRGCQFLAKADWKCLYSLVLKNNPIGEKGIQQLSKAQWKHLQKLDLWNCQIEDNGCEHLSKAQWTDLRVLILRNNKIGNMGCQFLSQGPWPHLFQLNLRNNNISDEGCIFLANSQCNNLHLLNLRSNGVGNKGCKLLSLAPWKQLSLDLNGNAANKKGLDYFQQLKWIVYCDNEEYGK